MLRIFHSGNLIIGGFIVAALSMLYLAYKTTTVHFDLAEKGDYYVMEAGINDQLRARQRADELGADFEIKMDAQYVFITLPPRISSKIQNGKVEFYCYSDAEDDKAALLMANEEGHYSFVKSAYMPGKNYNVKISFEVEGAEYYKEIKLD